MPLSKRAFTIVVGLASLIFSSLIPMPVISTLPFPARALAPAEPHSDGLDAFVAFMPLSNWIRGFERYAMRYSKRALPNLSYPDRFYMFERGEDASAGIQKARALAARLGEASDKIVWIESRLPKGPGRMEPNAFTGTGLGWAWPEPEVPVSRVGTLGPDGEMVETTHEEATALAYAACRGAGALDWGACAPRTFSVLPIANACQAKCAFCFSKASASEAAKQRPLDVELARAWARAARAAGARRAVITGGGEPTLIKPEALERLARALSEEVGPTLLITNGALWSSWDPALLDERLERLAQAGLSRVALSRHGVGAKAEAAIMGIEANAAAVARALRRNGRIQTRSICVLQKGGVQSAKEVGEYLRSMAAEGVAEVCFKELYVSALSENGWAQSAENRFARERQVALRVAIEALQEMGFEKSAELPWGSPLFSGRVDGVKMSVAAYTEPSVGWELANRQCRSWNLMSDGRCLASLEDDQSALSLSADGEA